MKCRCGRGKPLFTGPGVDGPLCTKCLKGLGVELSDATQKLIARTPAGWWRRFSSGLRLKWKFAKLVSAEIERGSSLRVARDTVRSDYARRGKL